MNLGVTPTSITQQVEYLRTLPAIRQRCGQVFGLAAQDKLDYFDYHSDHERDVVDFCVEIMKRDYGRNIDSIPPHGRWRHLDSGIPRVGPMISEWKASPSPPDDKEITRRLIDVFLVSVLLDAGAGSIWKYTEPGTNKVFSRSEGLGVASIHMFRSGFFSGDPSQPYRVDATGLSRVTPEDTATAMQVSPSNPMTGIAGRATLLSNLAKALSANPSYFGANARPGNIVDFLETQSLIDSSGIRRVHVAALWHVLIDGLATIWPSSRTTLGGVPLGDVWPCEALRRGTQRGSGPTPSSVLGGGGDSKPELTLGEELVPFHKLTGWTTYSLLEPLQVILKWVFDGLEDLTGLPEYRNGGLLVDLRVLSLRPDVIPRTFYPDSSSNIPRLPPSHPAIVEWRALTVILLDRIADGIRQRLGLTAAQLTLAQVLESATWKGGREIAKQLRPQTGGPPIEIDSDGTVF